MHHTYELLLLMETECTMSLTPDHNKGYKCLCECIFKSFLFMSIFFNMAHFSADLLEKKKLSI